MTDGLQSPPGYKVSEPRSLGSSVANNTVNTERASKAFIAFAPLILLQRIVFRKIFNRRKNKYICLPE
jgi:hypothetical protein